MKSRVTTKRGDLGETVTIAGDCLSKSHPILACCGKVDSLRAQTAACRLTIMESGRSDAEELSSILYWLLHTYFLIGALPLGICARSTRSPCIPLGDFRSSAKRTPSACGKVQVETS